MCTFLSRIHKRHIKVCATKKEINEANVENVKSIPNHQKAESMIVIVQSVQT